MNNISHLPKSTPLFDHEEEAPLPCLVCGEVMETAIPHLEGFQINQPHKGIGFSSPGHYGSSFHDDLQGLDRAEIAVCDDCLEKGHEKGSVRFVRVTRPPAVSEVIQRPDF